mgnify:CR=1 FL=1
MANQFLVIMPTYNEIGNLEHSIAELFKYSSSFFSVKSVDFNCKESVRF